MTCFVVWHGRTANWTSKDEKSGKSVRRTVTKLGTMGRAEVFKARSRLERDLWVMGIAMEIERLNVGRGREVEVVPTGRK